MESVELKVEDYLNGNRLSTRNNIDGKVSIDVLRAFFRKTCPFVVTIIPRRETLYDFQLGIWCRDNCIGYWTNSTAVKEHWLDDTWHFELEVDAVMFKLIHGS